MNDEAFPEDFVATLRVEEGPHHEGERIHIGRAKQALSIGKHPEQDIVLTGMRISRRHCRIDRDAAGRWTVTDDGSTNGTWLNGERIEQGALNSHDELQVGDFRLTFHLRCPSGTAREQEVPAAAGAAGAELIDEGGSWELAGEDGPLEPVADDEPLELADDDGPLELANDDASPAPAGEEDRLELDVEGGPAAAPGAEAQSFSAGTDGQVVANAPQEAAPAVAGEDIGLDLAALAAPDDLAPRAAEAPSAADAEPGPTEGDGPACPACARRLKKGASICTDCGINVHTGRALVTASGLNENQVHMNTESAVRIVSWFVPIGIYPVASEAYGRHRPWTTRALVIVTVLVSAWFLLGEWSGTPQMQRYKQLMLWAGGGDPDPDRLRLLYTHTSWGDREALLAEAERQAAAQPDSGATVGAGTQAPAGEEPSWIERTVARAGALHSLEDEALVEAHRALPVQDRATGEFRVTQLITHAFLHGGIMHLAGNMLFLMVFGSRVNARLGSVLTAALYPVLAVAAAVAHLVATSGDAPAPMVGASGAIMGLAGMYLVLFPVHRVFMAAWIRLGLIAGFRLCLKVWALRGFWVVAFYIAFDVAFVAFGVRDNTAHWAHLGGFLAGMVIAMILLVSRAVRGRGGDLPTALLGRHAWPLVGPPNEREDAAVLVRLP